MMSFFAPVPPEQRASDADRDTAVDILCAAAADGRLTLADLEERAEIALSARTLRQLAALIADLMSVSPQVAPVVSPPEPRVLAAPGDRWTVLRSLLEPAFPSG